MVTRKDDLITIELPQNGYKVYSQDLFVTQWNKGQKLAILGITDGTEVQFGNEIVETTLNRRVENGIVEIPDIMLTYAEPIIAYVQVITADSETTRYEILIRVEERTKPSDYIEPEDEQSFRQYMEQIMLETKAIAENKQDQLIAGENITIKNNVISATGGSADVDLSGLVPNTRKVAGKELKEDITAEDIINSFYDNTGKLPLSMLEILLGKSSVIGTKANKSEALKLIQVSLTGGVRLEYVDGSTAYTEVFGIQELLQDIETKADKTYVDTKLNEIKLAQMVDELPEVGLDGVMYLVPKVEPDTNDLFDEYKYINGAWEHIGSKQITIDLSNYPTKEEMESAIKDATNDEWELINTIEVAEDTGSITCNTDANGNYFAYKEIKVVASSVLGTANANFGINLYNARNTENSVTRMVSAILLANPMSATTQKHFFVDITRETDENRLSIKASTRAVSAYQLLTNQGYYINTATGGDEYIRKVNIYFSSTNVCSAGTFKFFGRKKQV